MLTCKLSLNKIELIHEQFIAARITLSNIWMKHQVVALVAWKKIHENAKLTEYINASRLYG
jgi:hypothetical protein